MGKKEKTTDQARKIRIPDEEACTSYSVCFIYNYFTVNLRL